MQPSARKACAGVRLLILDATRLGCESLASKLRKDRCEVVYAGTSVNDALAQLGGVEVALISSVLEGDPNGGFQLAKQIQTSSPNVKRIMMVDQSDPHSVVQAFRSGARGIFARDAPLELISKCISRVHEGQVWVNNLELQHLLEALNGPQRMRLLNAKGIDILTPREQEVVHWASEGLSNREIGNELRLSENTVKNYLFRIFDKLGISSRTELVLYAAAQRVDKAGVSGTRPNAATDGTVESIATDEAVSRGNSPYYMIAERYRTGRGVQRDESTALMWFVIAEFVSENALIQSKQMRSQLERKLNNAEVASAKLRAQEWLRKRNELAMDDKALPKTA